LQLDRHCKGIKNDAQDLGVDLRQPEPRRQSACGHTEPHVKDKVWASLSTESTPLTLTPEISNFSIQNHTSYQALL
jgi:hypothetical protein